MTRLKVPIIDPNYQFNTPVSAGVLPIFTPNIPGSYDRENPDIQSYKLFVFCQPASYVATGYIQATLMLTSSIKLPFLIDLDDLVLSIDGVLTPFSYITPWTNNACTIRFIAPATGGTHTGTLQTSYPVDMSSSTFTFTVAGTPTNCALIGTPWTPVDARDVTIIQVTAEPVIHVAGQTVHTSVIENTSSSIQAGIQAFPISAPSTPITITPAWFSFQIEAYHPNFSEVTCDLSFSDINDDTLWTIPIRIPQAVNNVVNINVPYSDWDDDYTLLKVLSEDIGWQDGTFTLTWTHLNNDPIPVALVNFTVSVADPSTQPIVFTDQNSNPIAPILPIIWVNGTTYLTFWSDTDVLTASTQE